VPIRLGDRKILAVPPILTSARRMLLDMHLDDLDNLPRSTTVGSRPVRH
jgi:hypothetical protein